MGNHLLCADRLALVATVLDEVYGFRQRTFGASERNCRAKRVSRTKTIKRILREAMVICNANVGQEVRTRTIAAKSKLFFDVIVVHARV